VFDWDNGLNTNSRSDLFLRQGHKEI